MLVAQAVRAAEIFHNTAYNNKVIDEIFSDILKQKENIVLIGMPASGKSTVGAILSKRLGRKLVDTDELIRQRIGTSIKNYIEKEGEESFRKIEKEVIHDLAGDSSLIISTGGGAILKEENITALRLNGKIFFIDRPIDDIIPTESRPLSCDRESLEKRYMERYPIYCDCCDVRINADCSADEVADKILESF